MSTAIGRLVRAEVDLMTRDPLVLTFVFAFPIVTMLIIGGAFGTTPDQAFDGVNPAHWYVASYLTVVIAATGLVMLPVHLASYRERGVLRRFAAAGFPRWSFAIAQLIVGLLTTAVACALLLAVAAPVYGIPAVHDGWRVAVALPLGAIAFVSIGVLLGSLLPSARAAQAVGLLIFFPSFLLGAGGPPPHVMGSVVRQVAGPLPLTLLTNAVREPWLGLGPATGSLIGVAVLAVAAYGAPRRCDRTAAVMDLRLRPVPGGRRIRSMSGDLQMPGRVRGYLAGRAKWIALAVFAAVIAVGALGFTPVHPSAAGGRGRGGSRRRRGHPARAEAAARAAVRRGGDRRDRRPRGRPVEQHRLVRRCACSRAGACWPAAASRPGLLGRGDDPVRGRMAVGHPDPGWGAWLAGVTLTVGVQPADQA